MASYITERMVKDEQQAQLASTTDELELQVQEADAILDMLVQWQSWTEQEVAA